MEHDVTPQERDETLHRYGWNQNRNAAWFVATLKRWSLWWPKT